MGQFNPNEQQQAIVDWVRGGRGSANVVARAGCGKTTTLIQGVIRAIVEEELGEVSLMAFNKSAADEFKQKIGAIAQDTGDDRFNDWKRVSAGTVHSFGFGAVRRWARDVKVDDKKVDAILREMSGDDPLSVYARESQPIQVLVSLAKQNAFGFLTGADDVRAWYDLAIHHAVNDLTENASLDEVIQASVRVLRESARQDREVVDFDDMVLAPLIHNLKMWPKDWVLIDEAQDTNAARRALALKMLKPRTGRLVAVGDDRQAIYGFAGADADAMDLIAAELGSQTLPLTVTYRCPKAVVREANRMVPDLVAHDSAPEGEARTVASTAPDGGAWYLRERPGKGDAVLCRNTKPLVELAYQMLADGVGCRVAGREIGEGLVKLATRWKRVKTLEQLCEKLVDYRDRETQKWQAKGREDRAQAAQDRADALVAVANALSADGKSDVQDLVDWIRALFDGRGDADVVTLSTVHKAKGAEWNRVYVLYPSRTMPSPWARKDWQIKQEENLEYVAVTRAQRELVYVEE